VHALVNFDRRREIHFDKLPGIRTAIASHGGLTHTSL
jgi:hypothetical protein